MRKTRKGFIAKVSAVVLTLALGFWIIGGISYASNTGNKPFLDDGIEYGIICNELNQTADMETNFIAGKYQGNGHTIGNTVSDDKANAAGVIKVGEVVGKMKVRGNPVIIEDPSIKEEVKKMIESVSEYAEKIAKKCDLEAPEVTDQNRYTIDAAAVDEDVVYVDATNMIEAMRIGKLQPGALTIEMKKDQTVVLNSLEKVKFTIPRYSVKITDGKKSTEEIAETVIWNLPKLADLEIESDNMHSTIIAPKAGVYIRTTGEGWLVCDQVVGNSGE